MPQNRSVMASDFEGKDTFGILGTASRERSEDASDDTGMNNKTGLVD